MDFLSMMRMGFPSQEISGISGQAFLYYKPYLSKNIMLSENYPGFDDEKLYRHARLVTSAVLAKIHTIDWTVELLRTDTLLAGMRINWYGFLGKKIKDLFGHIGGPVLSGLVGLRRPRDHGVPYSLTEEFVSVYRMHSLLPEKLILRGIHSTASEYECPPGADGGNGWKRWGDEIVRIGMEQMLRCGAIKLWNYPSWMRNLVPHDINGEDRPDQVDMAAMEIYRDRERGVARYNEFRRNLLMIPISSWEDLTDEEEVIEALHDVYGNDVEKLDLLIGLHAEKKIKGFAISETAFFIFLLIASRRLESDRFFTSNFNSRTYTEKGLEWVNKTETLKDVIDRHFPGHDKEMDQCTSAFSVWDSEPNQTTYIPLHVEAIRYINPGDLDKCNVPGHRPEDCRPPPRPPLNTPRRPCLKKERCRGGDEQSLVSEQRGNENLPFLGSSSSPRDLDKCNVPGHRPEDCRRPPRPPLNTPRRPCLKKDRCRGGDKQSLVSEQRGNENLPFLGSSYSPRDLDKCNVPGHRPEDCRPPPRPPLNTPRRPCLKKDRCRGGDEQSLVSEQRGNENLPILGSSYSPTCSMEFVNSNGEEKLLYKIH
uniref:Uncharacterized protein n=1 Tax=Salix viminalis TaxID=40686 RepID=A0A6N2KA61_SALVM